MLFFAIPGKIYIPMTAIYAVLAVAAVIALVLFLRSKSGKAPAAAPAAAAPAAAAPAVAEETSAAPVAPGSAGRLKLYDTPPKTAAMVMAIVADRLGKPINELRFISIKEVK